MLCELNDKLFELMNIKLNYNPSKSSLTTFTYCSKNCL